MCNSSIHTGMNGWDECARVIIIIIIKKRNGLERISYFIVVPSGTRPSKQSETSLFISLIMMRESVNLLLFFLERERDKERQTKGHGHLFTLLVSPSLFFISFPSFTLSLFFFTLPFSLPSYTHSQSNSLSTRSIHSLQLTL